jgi:hypothetical protein
LEELILRLLSLDPAGPCREDGKHGGNGEYDRAESESGPIAAPIE